MFVRACVCVSVCTCGYKCACVECQKWSHPLTLIAPDEFGRAAYICLDTPLDPVIVNAVFSIFDADGMACSPHTAHVISRMHGPHTSLPYPSLPFPPSLPSPPSPPSPPSLPSPPSPPSLPSPPSPPSLPSPPSPTSLPSPPAPPLLQGMVSLVTRSSFM